MARGQQKLQSQQRAAKKAAEMKRQQGHDQKSAAQAALIHKCSVCMVSFYGLFKWINFIFTISLSNSLKCPI